MQEKLERILIIVLSIGFVLMLGNQLDWWGPKEHKVIVVHCKKNVKPDTIPSQPAEQEITPIPEYPANY